MCNLQYSSMQIVQCMRHVHKLECICAMRKTQHVTQVTICNVILHNTKCDIINISTICDIINIIMSDTEQNMWHKWDCRVERASSHAWTWKKRREMYSWLFWLFFITRGDYFYTIGSAMRKRKENAKDFLVEINKGCFEIAQKNTRPNQLAAVEVSFNEKKRTQKHKCINTQIHKHTITQVYKCREKYQLVVVGSNEMRRNLFSA